VKVELAFAGPLADAPITSIAVRPVITAPIFSIRILFSLLEEFDPPPLI
jgi:hypothetical protein